MEQKKIFEMEFVVGWSIWTEMLLVPFIAFSEMDLGKRLN